MRKTRLVFASVIALGAWALSPALGPLRPFAPPEALSQGEPALPHPAPQTRAGSINAAAENQRCERCHQEIGAEWRASLHRSAAVDPVFVRAHAIEPRQFCIDCHDPEDNAELGVGCVTCHLTEGEVLGPRTRSESDGVHAVRGASWMSESGACASCHEFPFPDQPGTLQRTMSEHARSSFRDSTCQDCHMPMRGRESGKPYRSHGFQVWGDPDLIRSAVRVRAERRDARTVVLQLIPGRVGHAFPTGDLFRRVVAEAVTVGGERPAVRAAPVVLARIFGNTPAGRIEIDDTRLGPPGTEGLRELALGFDQDISDQTVRYRLVYQRMDDATATMLGVDPRKDELVINAGDLPPTRAAASTPE